MAETGHPNTNPATPDLNVRDLASSYKTGWARFPFALRVLIKGLALFLLVNLCFAWLNPLDALGKISAYNRLVPGRDRLPYADNPDKAYSLTLNNINAMFASHEISAEKKPADEYRVLLIGDSSTWGYLLRPDETLSENLNAADQALPDQRKLRFYNLGYPVMSVAKDLLLLSHALAYEPDMIVWLVTLESFPEDKQLFSPLIKNNFSLLQKLNQQFDLKLNLVDQDFDPKTLWDKTLIGSRRELADLFRLQLYGPSWAATGIDQEIPDFFTPRQEDLEEDTSFHSLKPPELSEKNLFLNILEAGIQMAGSIPIVFINEPMFISRGKNSDIRYNFYYPRWAYDDYRKMMTEKSIKNQWHYRDFWNAIPASEFSNSAVHLTPAGSREFAVWVLQAILEEAAVLSK